MFAVSRNKRFSFYLLLMIINIIVCCIVLEVFVRVFEYYSHSTKLKNFTHTFFEIENSFIERSLKPYCREGVQVQIQGTNIVWHFILNSYGLRGNEISYNKAPNVIRILVLGDSYTFGWAVEQHEPYPIILQELLNSRLNTQYEVINAGIPGCNTFNEYHYLITEGHKFNPDIIILGFVMNDAEYSLETPQNPKITYKDNFLWWPEFVKFRLNVLYFNWTGSYWFKDCYRLHNTNYLDAYEKGNKKGDGVRLHLRKIRDFALDNNITFYVVILPDVSKPFYDYQDAPIHEIIKKWCSLEGIPVLDLFPLFKNTNNVDYMMAPDDHPNGKAHRIFAQQIASFIQKGAYDRNSSLESSVRNF